MSIDLKNITHLDRFPKETSQILHVEWRIGKRCNYDCTYCHSNAHDNFSPHVKMVHIINSMNKIIEKFQKNGLNINITGGEPVVHPEFDKLCEFLFDKNLNVSMTTNGSRSAEYYTKIYKAFNHITFSHHFEHTKNEVFLPKMKFINENRGKKHMKVQVMYHAQFENEILESIRYYEINNIPYTVRRIRPTNPTHPDQSSVAYTDEQLETIKKYQLEKDFTAKNIEVTSNNETYVMHTNELLGHGMKNYKGWLCWAGVNFIRIHDNLVYRCWGEIRTPIGNITDPNFTLLTEPSPCIANKCMCAPELATKKIKTQS